MYTLPLKSRYLPQIAVSHRMLNALAAFVTGVENDAPWGPKNEEYLQTILHTLERFGTPADLASAQILLVDLNAMAAKTAA